MRASEFSQLALDESAEEFDYLTVAERSSEAKTLVGMLAEEFHSNEFLSAASNNHSDFDSAVG